MGNSNNSFFKIIKSLGVVFGDIGTSPIYTIGAILLFILPTVDNILGLLSLIVWSLVIVITVQYAWLAMYLGSKGEGGTIVLKGLLTSSLKNLHAISFVSVLTIIGVALFIGDGACRLGIRADHAGLVSLSRYYWDHLDCFRPAGPARP